MKNLQLDRMKILERMMIIKRLLLSLTLILTFCAFGKNPGMNEIDKRNLIIDTDVGIDDAMALAYIFQHKSIHVSAITIATDGNTSCQEGYNNIKAIVNQFAKYDIPIACGQNTPLKGVNKFPQPIIDLMNKHAAVNLEKKNYAPEQDAVALLYKTIANSEQPLNILTLGPYTNIAQLLIKHPEIKNKIYHIYSMAGVLNMTGNIHDLIPNHVATASEWNVFIDPFAANYVVESGIPITMVPLNVTKYAPINMEFLKLISANPKTPASKFVIDIITSNLDFLKSGWYFWDPMAATLMLHPELASCLKQKIKILQDPNGPNDGKLILDEKHGSSINVCLELYNRDAFYQEFINALNYK